MGTVLCSVLSPVTKGQSSIAKGTSKKILTFVEDPEERNSLIYHARKRTFFFSEGRGLFRMDQEGV